MAIPAVALKTLLQGLDTAHTGSWIVGWFRRMASNEDIQAGLLNLGKADETIVLLTVALLVADLPETPAIMRRWAPKKTDNYEMLRNFLEVAKTEADRKEILKYFMSIPDDAERTAELKNYHGVLISLRTLVNKFKAVVTSPTLDLPGAGIEAANRTASWLEGLSTWAKKHQ